MPCTWGWLGVWAIAGRSLTPVKNQCTPGTPTPPPSMRRAPARAPHRTRWHAAVLPSDEKGTRDSPCREPACESRGDDWTSRI
uniref:Secreted protein n=1 Tax=Setaria italica TaxID=4555 RepID=K3YNU2_SETIT